MSLFFHLPECRPLYDYWPPWRNLGHLTVQMRDSQLVYIIHLATETSDSEQEQVNCIISLKSLWSKLGWRHWRLKHLDHLKTHSVLRSWCWTMRLYKNDQAIIQLWINFWLQSRLTLKHGWRLTADGWRITVELLLPQRRGVLGEPFCLTYQKQWAFYHTTEWDKKQGWRLTDIGWTPELLFPQRTGALKGAVLCDKWGSELPIIALQDAESGLKQ